MYIKKNSKKHTWKRLSLTMITKQFSEEMSKCLKDYIHPFSFHLFMAIMKFLLCRETSSWEMLLIQDSQGEELFFFKFSF